MNARGFILVSITFFMLLIGVTSLALNRKSSLQSRMAENQNQKAKTALGQEASLEQAIWQLSVDPLWWTDSASKDFTYDGVTYTRTVQKSGTAGYEDANTISVTAPGSTITSKASVRHYIRPPVIAPGISHPLEQLCIDNGGNIYFISKDEHRVYRYNGISGDITAVAGNGTSGFSGDGGLATAAQLKKPRGVAMDTSGNLYIADTDNDRIRKVTGATGTINTIAGTGTAGYNGDGIAATTAQVRKPKAIAIWGSDVFIADTDNNRIRRVDGGTGVISTVAGNGTGGDSGDYSSATSAQIHHPYGISFFAGGDFVFADEHNNRIRKVRYSSDQKIYPYAGTGTGGYTGDGGQATAATLAKPLGVFVAGNDVYISDTDNHAARKVTGATGIIDTIAGTGSPGYTGDGGLPTLANLDKPTGIWVDASGRVIIADKNNNVVRRIVVGTSISSLYTPGGLGLSDPRHIAVSSNGDLYIADSGNHRIRMLSSTGDIATVAGTGSAGYSGDGGDATSAKFDTPNGIALDAAGDLYIADSGNHCIRKITKATGIITRIAGNCTTSGDSGNGGPAMNARFNSPRGIDVDSTGAIYVADTPNCWIRKFTEGGDIDIYAGGNWFGDPWCGSGTMGWALNTLLEQPLDIRVDAAGNGYIADTENHTIWKVDTTGQIFRIAGTGTPGYSGDGGLATSAAIDAPSGLTVDPSGNIYFTDRDRHVVRGVSSYNGFIYRLAGIAGSAGYNGTDMPAIDAKLDGPAGIEIAAFQGKRRFYICDWKNSRVRILDYAIEKELY